MKVTIDCKLSAEELEDALEELHQVFLRLEDEEDNADQLQALRAELPILQQVQTGLLANTTIKQ
jgi:hypothetical protein